MSKTATATKRSNFLTHEALITKGSALCVEGWIAVALEAQTFKSVSEYAKISAKNTTEHTEATIRQYASFIIVGLKKYGGKAEMLEAYDEVYTYRAISELRKFLSGKGQRDADKKTKRFSAVKVANELKAKYTPAEIASIKARL